jgi:hypothetical protein
MSILLIVHCSLFTVHCCRYDFLNEFMYEFHEIARLKATLKSNFKTKSSLKKCFFSEFLVINQHTHREDLS